jgi:ABC-type multidrug transport system fused ATPase/permease subunit
LVEIGGYVGLSVVQAFLVFWFSIVLAIAGTNASKVMLHRAMRRTLRAPMSFFDTTPLGRITNRFSKDTDIMDNNLADAMRMYLQSLSCMFLHPPCRSLLTLLSNRGRLHPDHRLLSLCEWAHGVGVRNHN